MTCPKCGNELSATMKFCAKCGTAVAQQPVQQQPPVAQQTPAQPPQNVPNQQPPVQPPKKKKTGIIITAVILVIALIAGGIGLGIWLGNDDKGDKTSTSSEESGENNEKKEDKADNNSENEKDNSNNNEDNSTNNDRETSIVNAQIGSYITFGEYEQDGNTSNGKEDIEWLVLDVQDGKALVISKYALDAKAYNEEYEEVTWETCTLRTWLNNEFYNTAFSNSEKNKISTTNVVAEDNPYEGTEAGNNTQDKVFLLSISEAETYFSSDDERCCKPTQYAVNNGAYESSSYDGNCWWWLRSPGIYQSNASNVFIVGFVFFYGYFVGDCSSAVRPVLWVNL